MCVCVVVVVGGGGLLHEALHAWMLLSFLVKHPMAPSLQDASTCWRILTGHDNGQLLLWHPRASRLAPLIQVRVRGGG